MKRTHSILTSHFPALCGLLMVVCCLLLSGCYSVKSVSGSQSRINRGGMFYALPVTRICVDLTYQYYDLTDAVYSDYAADMLALDNFETDKPYHVTHVDVSYTVSADPENYYLVNPRGTSVQVDSRHLLRSVGMTPREVAGELGPAQDIQQGNTPAAKLTLHNANADKLMPRYNLYDRTDTFYVRGDKPGRPSMTSTKKSYRSLKQRAQAAAEEIAELEDMRADIAVSDRYTTEGKAEMLQQLEQQKADLLAQFIGRPVTETVHFYLTPAPANRTSDTLQELVLFYFSRSEGVCDSDDVGALPVVCRMRPDPSLQKVRRFSRRRAADSKSPLLSFNRNFKYRIPSLAEFTLSCELFDYEATLPVAQFGPVMDLPHTRFKALFDPTTGALIYYHN